MNKQRLLLPALSVVARLHLARTLVLRGQVLKVEDQGGEVGFRYYIHYIGWAQKYDEWVLGERLTMDCEQGRAEQQKLAEAVKARLAAPKRKRPSTSTKRSKAAAGSDDDDDDSDGGPSEASLRAEVGDPDTVRKCDETTC